MDSKNFFIELSYNNKTKTAEVKPCCQEDNVYYYDVYMKDEFQFTITPAQDNNEGIMWKISLKNADKQVEPELVELVGEQIEKHFFDVNI